MYQKLKEEFESQYNEKNNTLIPTQPTQPNSKTSAD
jgi:hypothetical protein